MHSRPAWATLWDSVSTNKTKKEERKKSALFHVGVWWLVTGVHPTTGQPAAWLSLLPGGFHIDGLERGKHCVVRVWVFRNPVVLGERFCFNLGCGVWGSFSWCTAAGCLLPAMAAA